MRHCFPAYTSQFPYRDFSCRNSARAAGAVRQTSASYSIYTRASAPHAASVRWRKILTYGMPSRETEGIQKHPVVVVAGPAHVFLYQKRHKPCVSFSLNRPAHASRTATGKYFLRPAENSHQLYGLSVSFRPTESRFPRWELAWPAGDEPPARFRGPEAFPIHRSSAETPAIIMPILCPDSCFLSFALFILDERRH